MKNEKKAMFFKGNEAEDFRALERMSKQIGELGGELHFTIHKTEDGWMAKCNEVEGIITGGVNPCPEDYEIQSQIREAIYTAFDIKTKISPERIKSSVSELTLAFS
jgi:hypothetical protein